jgi:hypothetical protein
MTTYFWFLRIDDLLDERLLFAVIFLLDLRTHDAGGLRQRLYRLRSAYPLDFARA